MSDTAEQAGEQLRKTILIVLGVVLGLLALGSLAVLITVFTGSSFRITSFLLFGGLTVVFTVGGLGCLASAFGILHRVLGGKPGESGYERSLLVALQSPILVREMRALLRGRKFFVSHMLLLTILAGVLLIAATTAAAGPDKDPAQVGLILFRAFFVGLSVVVIFLVPAFSCTAVTTERESKTLDLLLTTTIRPWEVVWGKLLSALVVILLFMASALPLVTVCFLFGGISPWDLALLYSGVLFSTLVVSSVSLSVSAHCKESKSAVVISYVLTLIFTVLLGIAVVMISAAFLAGRGAGAFAAVLSGYHWGEQLLFFAIPAFLGVSIFSANFAAASNRLKPATANRSTNLRLIWIGFLALSVIFYVITVLLESNLDHIVATGGGISWEDMLISSLGIMAPLLWLGAIYFSSEEAILPPRVVDDTKKLWGPLIPLRVFMPGPLTGVAYTVFFVLLSLGAMTAFNSVCAAAAGRPAWAWSNVSAAVPLTLFIFTAAGIAALFSSFGFTHRGAGLAAFGATAVLAFGPLILLLCEDAISGPAESTLWNLHYLSPIVAMVSAWETSVSGWSDVLLPLGGRFPLWAVSALAYAVLSILIWIWADVRVVRLRGRWQRQLDLAAEGRGDVRELRAGVPVAAPVAAPVADSPEGGAPVEER